MSETPRNPDEGLRSTEQLQDEAAVISDELQDPTSPNLSDDSEVETSAPETKEEMEWRESARVTQELLTEALAIAAMPHGTEEEDQARIQREEEYYARELDAKDKGLLKLALDIDLDYVLRGEGDRVSTAGTGHGRTNRQRIEAWIAFLNQRKSPTEEERAASVQRGRDAYWDRIEERIAENMDMESEDGMRVKERIERMRRGE